MDSKLASRKFLVSVLGIVVQGAMAWFGKMPVDQAMQNVMILVGVYVVGEAFVDAYRGATGGSDQATSAPSGLNLTAMLPLIRQIVGSLNKPAESASGPIEIKVEDGDSK